MKKIDKKAELIKRLQAERDRRTQLENRAVTMIENNELEKAIELIHMIDDTVIRDIEKELDRLSRSR